MVWMVLAAVLFLAWSNGANDNFKGVATLYGSRTTSYRTALAWATGTTAAGSLLALALAGGLVKTFSAKGLVPDAVATSPEFLAAAALGAALTVLVATRLGLPVSTTHALTGALVGAGVAAPGAAVNLGLLGRAFFLPLILSPLVATLLVALLYPLATRGRRALGIDHRSCVCVGEVWVPTETLPTDGAAAGARGLAMTVGTAAECAIRYQGAVVGLPAQGLLDGLHLLSAGSVSFARGLNDTPKIVALLLAARAVAPDLGLVLVGGAMALGGLVGARRVAETLSHRITRLNAGQGFVANLTTAALVIGASRVGLPVSTTHVSTGGLFGLGAVTGEARWSTVATILAAWLTTLPLAAALGALALFLLRR